MTNVHGRKVQGGSFPAQIWARYMKKALEDTPKSNFPRPIGAKKTYRDDEGTVPNVIGMSASKATSRLTRAGFRVSQTYQKSNKSYGTVISQTPKAGSDVKAGSEITIDISDGASSGTVPAVIGLSESQAKSVLQDSGFSVSVQYVSSPSQAGKVVSQSPSSGTEQDAGSSVTIVIAQ